MSTLTQYIEKLKKDISEIGDMNDIGIMRYVYIDLGRKMNFDLNYTFGNNKEKNKIYNRAINEDELNHVLETRTIICKSLAYLLERILKEFNINIRTERVIEGDKLRKTHIQYSNFRKWRRIYIRFRRRLRIYTIWSKDT